MKLSVIVPIYNTGFFLSSCIESILSQSFTDFELLLINDGSTDDSGSICDSYAQIDSRIHVIHKNNGGVCSARNAGIDESKGDYIVFVDADDWVSTQYLEHLMVSDSDWVISGIRKFNAIQAIEAPSDYIEFSLSALPIYWNTPPIMNFIYCYPVAKRFKASIIRENKLRFNETLFFSEDICFNMEYLFYSETLANLPYVDYMYRMEEITRDDKYKMSAFQLKSHFEYFEKCLSKLYERIGDNVLSFVQENTHLRMTRKFFNYLQHSNSLIDFSENISFFRDQIWSKYLLSILKGKRERRFMQEAILFPALTYLIEVRFRGHFIR